MSDSELPSKPECYETMKTPAEANDFQENWRGGQEPAVNPRFQKRNWWRRRESNPRPKMLLVKSLHAYSRSCPGHYPRTFAVRAQNGQETRPASL